MPVVALGVAVVGDGGQAIGGAVDDAVLVFVKEAVAGRGIAPCCPCHKSSINFSVVAFVPRYKLRILLFCHYVNSIVRHKVHIPTDNGDMDLWDRIRGEIEAQKTTQEWVARQIGVRADLFRRWLSRKTMPNADQVVGIAEALGTSVEYLVKGIRPTYLSSKDKLFFDKALRYREIVFDFDDVDVALQKQLAGAIHGAAEEARAARMAEAKNA